MTRNPPASLRHLDPYPSLFKQSFVSKTSASPSKFPGQQFAFSFLDNSFLDNSFLDNSFLSSRSPAPGNDDRLFGDRCRTPHVAFRLPCPTSKRRVSLLGDSRKPAPMSLSQFFAFVIAVAHDFIATAK